MSIIYISHKLDEVFQIADDITVLRDGAVVDTHPASELDINAVITRMVGRKLESNYPKETIPVGEDSLRVDGLEGASFHNVSFHAARGEIVGFSGLMGAGRTEVMRALFGLDPILSGKVHIGGREVRIRRASDSIRHDMAILSEDRRRYGIVPMRSVKENCTLSSLGKIIFQGRLHSRLETSLVEKLFRSMRVKTLPRIPPSGRCRAGSSKKYCWQNGCSETPTS